MLVDTIVVQSLNAPTSTGLYATGEFGRGNALSNNRAAPTNRTFGTGRERNKVNVLRAKRSRFG